MLSKVQELKEMVAMEKKNHGLVAHYMSANMENETTNEQAADDAIRMHKNYLAGNCKLIFEVDCADDVWDER